VDSRLTTHTHTHTHNAFLSLDSSLPIITPPIWQRPPLSIMANNSPLFTPSISISILASPWPSHTIHTRRHIQKRRAVPHANITPLLVLTRPSTLLMCSSVTRTLRLRLRLTPCLTPCFTPKPLFHFRC